MKLRTRFMLAGGLPLLFVPIILLSLVFRGLYQTRTESVRMMLNGTAALAALEIGRDNARALELAKMIAVAQQNGMFGDRVRSLTLLRGMLEATPGITGTYVAYEPNADGNDASMPATGIDPQSLGEGGRFIPYWSRSIDNPDEIELSPLVNMNTSYYYRGLANLFNEVPEDQGIQLEGGVSSLYREEPVGSRLAVQMLTEPYVYEGKLIVEQTTPIVIDGQFAGIGGVDRTLDDIDDQLRRLESFDSAEFILVSKRGRIVSATMAPELRTQRIEDSPYAGLLTTLYEVGEIDDLLMTDDPLTGEQRVFVGISIPQGDWRLLLSVSHSETLGTLYRRTWQVLILVVVAGIVAMLIAGYFLRRIIARVERAASAVAQVAGGDLTEGITSSATDESGQMLRAIGDMVRSLDALVRKIKSASLQVMATATNISAAAQKQKETSSEVGASTNQIAASTTEISATSRELLQTMTEVAAATKETADVAASGRANLDRMEATMQQLLAATNSISGKLAVISERADNIGAVVTTITRVADQTNLLSLNAAIEASKAGEYGQGFSVVAREIRRLADQTAVATLDIERIVGQMQSSVTSGVTEMDSFDEQVRAGVQEATRLGAQLGKIIEGVEDLRPRFEIAQQSMQSQVVGAEQINEAMMELREIAMVGGESSERLDAASAQLLTALESLKAEVARFRTANP